MNKKLNIKKPINPEKIADYLEIISKAKKWLSILQHHDAITGTSKYFVMHINLLLHFCPMGWQILTVNIGNVNWHLLMHVAYTLELSD